jgi:hypothetical protein
MDPRNLVKLLGLTVLAAVSVLAVGASVAQAKYLALLNGTSVNSATLTGAMVGSGFVTAENGLKIECSSGTGTATATLSGTGEKATGSASAILTGCVWVGSEKTCTINDGGAGVIKGKGSGELIMEGTNYLVTATSAEFTTILTEGAFCTIPEEEVASGTAHALINNALADTKAKTAKLLNLSLKLGNSKIKELNATVEGKDENPNATGGIHLVNLTGCTPIC